MLKPGARPKGEELDRDAILRDYQAGVPLKTISAKYGCSTQYPATYAKRLGIERRGVAERSDSVWATRYLPELPDGFDSAAFLREHYAGASRKQLRSKFALDDVQIESLFERFAIKPNPDRPIIAAAGVVAEIKRLRGRGLFTTQIAALLRVPYRLVSEVQ